MAVFNRSRAGAKAPYFGLTGGWLTFWVVSTLPSHYFPPHTPSGVLRQVRAVWTHALLLEHVSDLMNQS